MHLLTVGRYALIDFTLRARSRKPCIIHSASFGMKSCADFQKDGQSNFWRPCVTGDPTMLYGTEIHEIDPIRPI